MSLVANYSCSSSEESETEDGSEEKQENRKEKEIPPLLSTDGSSDEESESEVNKLPLPSAILKQKGEHKLPELNVNKRKLSQNSIFSDPFAQSNASIEQTLSKHKRLTETKDQEPNKRQRKKQAKESEVKKTKLCVKFFKSGTCKFGDKCKFAHKLLSQQEHSMEFKEPDIVSQPDLVKKKKKNNNFMASTNDPNSEDEGQSVSKKKRPGLSNNLVPGKKVLQNYDKLCR